MRQVYGWVPVPSSKLGADDEENYVSDVRVKCFGQTPAETDNMNRSYYSSQPASTNLGGWNYNQTTSSVREHRLYCLCVNCSHALLF